jgi:aerobic carbon-monoxide dehydrogenase medium subunit
VSTLPAFSLVRPATLDDALAAIGDDAMPYAGGTEVLVAMRAGLLRAPVLVDLKRLPELAAVEAAGRTLRIGAIATHEDVARHAAVVKEHPMLASVLRRVGNARVRAQGTLGGNVCFAEPRSDVATALVAIGATVVLRSTRGERSLPVEEFVLGPFTTDRQPDELLVRIEVPTPGPDRATYIKYQVAERPTVGVAAVERADGGQPRRWVVVGAVSERPLAFDADDAGEVDAEAVAAAIEPIADLTGSEEYKRHVTAVYVRRALASLAGAA